MKYCITKARLVQIALFRVNRLQTDGRNEANSHLSWAAIAQSV